MRVLVRGWKRDCGATQLLDGDLKKTEIVDDVKIYSQDEVYIERRGLMHVISTNTGHVTLNGNYQIEVRLDIMDVFHLAADLLKGMSAVDLLKSLSGK